jgi:hypothetical protein
MHHIDDLQKIKPSGMIMFDRYKACLKLLTDEMVIQKAMTICLAIHLSTKKQLLTK